MFCRRHSLPHRESSAAALFSGTPSEAETERATASATTTATGTEDDDEDGDGGDKDNNDANDDDAAATTSSLSSSSSSSFLLSAASEATCGICLELVAAAHAVTSCGHVFCGSCIARTVEAASAAVGGDGGSGLRLPARCPVCRSLIRAPPVRVRMLDKVVSEISQGLPEDEEKASWRARVSAFDATTTPTAADGDENNNTNRRGPLLPPTAADAERIYAASFAPRRPAPIRFRENEAGDDEGGELGEGGGGGRAANDPPIVDGGALRNWMLRPSQRRRRLTVSNVGLLALVRAERNDAVRTLHGAFDRRAALARDELARAAAAARGGGVP